uniref:Uncharacterized protein n=1 Tax=Arundo donax TaxID=35708 RepID=A0A0A9FYN0_ARUDO
MKHHGSALSPYILALLMDEPIHLEMLVHEQIFCENLIDLVG